MRIALSCCDGVGLTAAFVLSSNDLILSFSWLTSDLRYSSSSDGDGAPIARFDEK